MLFFVFPIVFKPPSTSAFSPKAKAKATKQHKRPIKLNTADDVKCLARPQKTIPRLVLCLRQITRLRVTYRRTCEPVSDSDSDSDSGDSSTAHSSGQQCS